MEEDLIGSASHMVGTKGAAQAGIPLRDGSSWEGEDTDFRSVPHQMNRVTMQHFVTSRLQKKK